MKELVVVTGAAGSVGRSIVKLLSSSYDLVGFDRSEKPTDLQGIFHKINLCSEESAETAARIVLQTMRPIRAIIFSTGTYRSAPLDAYGNDFLEEIMWDNFKSTFFLTRALLPALVAQKTGRLIMITSQAAARGALDPGYAAAKGALQSFMKSIAQEYGVMGIRCNAISPGAIESTMSDSIGAERKAALTRTIPIGRFCTAVEVASVAAFLTQDGADSMNGATIDVDGGFLRR